MTDALAPGTRLGPYEIQALIGSGGMGRVYRAYDARLARHVAIKTIAESAAVNPEALRRFESEARAAGALDHPNLLVVFDVGREAGVSYIVSELLEGETLHDRQQRGALSERQVIDFAMQIARGLAATHARGVIHRDLKPANLFITRDRRIKILDFGVAKLTDAADRGDATMTAQAQTLVGMLVGTAGYMSPEQIRGEPVDARTDVFALGVLMHEMLTGARLFKRATTPDTLSAVLLQEPGPLPHTVSPALQRIVHRCLEKSPTDRFHAAHDVALALELLTDATRAATAPADAGRRRTLLYGASALGIAAAGVGAGIWAGRKGAEPLPTPSFRRLTYRRGMIRSARFAPDGQTVVFGALWDGDHSRVYSTRTDNTESSALDHGAAMPLAVSRTGELALALGPHLEGVFTYGTLARVPITGGVPRELVKDVKFADWSPDGSQLGLIRLVDGRDQLEYPIGKVLLRPTPDQGIGLGFVRVSPDGKRVAFVHYQDLQSLVGRICMADEDGRIHQLTSEYVNVHGLTWHGDRILYTASDSGFLLRVLFEVEPGGQPRALARVPANISVWDVASDGRVLMMQVDDRAAMIARLHGEEGDRDLSWLDVSWIIAVSSDGRQVLFGENGQGVGLQPAAYLRSTDGSSAVRLASGWPMALSPDGRAAIVATGPRTLNGSGDILEIVPVGAGEVQRLPVQGLNVSSLWWPKPGTRLLFRARTSDGAQRVYRLELPDGEPQPITPAGITQVTVSPDGERLAVRYGEQLVRIHRYDGSIVGEVPDLQVGDALLSWIDAGLLIMRPGDRDVPRGEVFLVNPTTGFRRRWQNILPQDAAGIMVLATFRATPDGNTRVFTWHRALCHLYLATGLT